MPEIEIHIMPENQKTVSANLAIDSEAHTALRELVKKTGLNNSEVVSALLSQIGIEEALKMLEPKVREKENLKRDRRKVKKEIEGLSKDKLEEVLRLINKGNEAR